VTRALIGIGATSFACYMAGAFNTNNNNMLSAVQQLTQSLTAEAQEKLVCKYVSL